MNVGAIAKSLVKGVSETLIGIGIWKTGETVVKAVKKASNTGRMKRLLSKEAEIRSNKKKVEQDEKKETVRKKGDENKD